jgi:subtilisin family serine protease
VKPNNPGTNFGFHGVLTLSNIAGYKPGQVIGPAPRASYILARTENDSSETPIEEDNWVAAIEWADSLGVQVTSTSLGYLTYDPPYTSWTWEDMNGHTTVITRAADLAVSKGIVVVNSAGNNGFNSLHNTLNAPADGDSVLTVGAVDSSGVRTGFSSVGPTTSSPPHIKPDVMGQGSLVYCASYTDPTGYIYSGGTSHSCPLVAGVAALMLSANPNLTPMQVVDALRSTASRSTHPDNEYGWGIVNAPAAINMNPSLLPTSYGLKQNFPNPFNAGTTITYDLPNSSSVTLKIFDVLGREVRTLVNDIQSAGNRRLLWDARDSRGAAVASGVYFYRLTATSVSQSFSETKKLVVVR